MVSVRCWIGILLRGSWDVGIARGRGENTGRMDPDGATMGFVSWFVKGLALKFEGSRWRSWRDWGLQICRLQTRTGVIHKTG